MRTRLQRLSGFWLFDALGFSLLCRFAAIALCGLWLYQGYVLGWTDILLGSVKGGSAWVQRDHYAARGLQSLQHLSVTNIARSVMVLPLVVVIFSALGWPRRIYGMGLSARSLFVAALLLLGIYSLINSDVPFNFYGSRYYLPTVIPFVMLAFGIVIASWPRALAVGAALLVTVGAGYHVYGLESVPAYQGSLKFQSDVADRTSGSDVAFLVGQRPLSRSIQLGLMSLSGLPVIFIDTDRAEGTEPRKLINEYMSALGAEQATIVSARRVAYGFSQQRIDLETSSIPFQIRYNTYQRQPEALHLYVGQYVDESFVLTNSRPQWVVGGILSLPLSRPGNAQDDHVVVHTGGGWQWANSKAGTAPRLELIVDGQPAELKRLYRSDFVFSLPAGVVGNQSMVIRSNTFIPAELGINADRRALGVDLISVRFGRDLEQSPPAPEGH